MKEEYKFGAEPEAGKPEEKTGKPAEEENLTEEKGKEENESPVKDTAEEEAEPQTEGKGEDAVARDRRRKRILLVLACVVLVACGIFSVLLIRHFRNADRKPAGEVSGISAAVTAGAAAETGEEPETELPVTEETETAETAETDTETSESSGEEEEAEEGLVLSWSANNSWESSGETVYGMEIGITNHTEETISGWTLVLSVPGIGTVSGWNGSFTAGDGTLTVTNESYNGDINPGGTVTIGCNLGITDGELSVSEATLNGIKMAVKQGAVAENTNSGGSGSANTNAGGSTGNEASDIDTEELLKRSDKAVSGDDWLYTDGNKIVDKDGKTVWLTGVNWFGYNTGTNTFDGLWNSELVSTVKAIADHGFNLIRVPMSAELLLQWKNGEYPKANYNNAYNTALNSMNSLEIWEYFLKLAEENGIKVMLDIHSAETNASGHTVNLWCTDNITVDQYYEALEWVAERYKDDDTLIAIDLKNEPHGKPYEGSAAAVWNDSETANNWKYVAQTAALRILDKNPNVLILVEGTEIYPKDISANGDYSSTSEEDYYFNWWGGNLRGVRDFPIDLGKYQNKLVYSPHDYGPTVYEQPWFSGSYTFKSLMEDCWEDNWFYIYEENIAPLLIGEWGGFMTEPNITWMTYMRELISTYHLHHTFWCLNANSGDTGGLLKDDFVTWDEEKYAFVKEVLWQENGKFVGLDHVIPLGENGISLADAEGLK